MTEKSETNSNPASVPATEDGCPTGVPPSRGEIGGPSGTNPAPKSEVEQAPDTSGTEEQGWAKCSTLPSWLPGLYWLMFDNGAMSEQPARRDNGAWFYGNDREHAEPVLFCKAVPPPASAQSGAATKDSTPSPGVPDAAADSGAEKPREAAEMCEVAPDNPGDGAGDPASGDSVPSRIALKDPTPSPMPAGGSPLLDQQPASGDSAGVVTHEVAEKLVTELQEGSWWLGWKKELPRGPTLLRYIDQRQSREAQLEREVGELKKQLADSEGAIDSYRDQRERFSAAAADLRNQLAQSEAGKAELEHEAGRMHYLGNMIRSRTQAEQDELTRLMRKHPPRTEPPAAPEPAKPAGEATAVPGHWVKSPGSLGLVGDWRFVTDEPTIPEPSASEKVVTVARLAGALRELAMLNDADTAPRHIVWQKLASRLERE